jgi:hypothetical protein
MRSRGGGALYIIMPAVPTPRLRCTFALASSFSEQLWPSRGCTEQDEKVAAAHALQEFSL